MRALHIDLLKKFMNIKQVLLKVLQKNMDANSIGILRIT